MGERSRKENHDAATGEAKETTWIQTEVEDDLKKSDDASIRLQIIRLHLSLTALRRGQSLHRAGAPDKEDCTHCTRIIF